MAEGHGWRVDKGDRYFRLKCPCGQHMKWCALTPSGAAYGTNLTKWLERQPCWRRGGGSA
jgi:hypothetical protein